MKVILYNRETEPAAKIECECGHKFWVDPCGEENLKTMIIGDKSRLVEVCPKCERTNRNQNLKYPDLDKGETANEPE